MQRFAYTGRSPVGAVNGTLEAASASAVADQLLARGITPLKIEADGQAGPAAVADDAPATDWRAWFRPRVTAVDLMLFCRQLNTLLRAGVPILRALLGLQDSATNLRFKDTLGEVRRSLESGIELSMTFAQHARVFDAFFIAMVRVGELTGRMEEIFLRLYKHIEFEMFMRQQVKAALRYPTFVVIAMMVAIGVINVMVIPSFESVFKQFGANLPLPTRILLASSRFTVQYGWLILLGAVVAAVAFVQWKNTPAGRLRWSQTVLSIPIAGKIVRKATLARFARSFALALKSGVPLEQALSVVAATTDNAYLAKRVEGMRESVERGESILRSAVAAGVFTPVVLQMIGVGEETGAIDEMMEEVAELYSNEVQYELKTLSQQIEPIMIVFLGALVLILALGVFVPMWDLGRVAFKK